jgi:hypothetical protein
VNGGIKAAGLAISVIAALTLIGTPAGATTQSADSAKAATAAKGTGARLQIRMIVVTQGTVPVAVKRFRFRGLLASCAGGNTVRVKGKIRRMNVNNNHFGRTIRRSGRKVHVEGNFQRRGSVVKGKIRAQGRFASQRNCDSGVVRWTAR